MEKYKRFAFDTILSLVFWAPVIGIWSYAVVKLDGWELVSIMAGTAIINASFVGIYGRLLNRWRKTFSYN